MTSEDLKRRTAQALIWSFAQSLGSRVLTFAVFIVLARMLEPAQFGIAASALFILSLVNLISEFGFPDAFVQREALKSSDLNLPFYVSVILSLISGLLLIMLSKPISVLLNAKDLGPLLIGVGALAPVSTLSQFQEGLYRRNLRFREIAYRTLIGIAAGGVIGIAMAMSGWGAWALLAQYAIQIFVSLIWLWAKRTWTPGKIIDVKVFKEIAAFGWRVLMWRLIDISSMRLVEVLILFAHGAAAAGLFATASRLCSTLVQALQGSLSSVGLSSLSRIVEDRERVARLYLRSSTLAASTLAPLFFGLSALAPEVHYIVFGQKWVGGGDILRPLLIVSGVSSVQFMNDTYLMALGKPRYLLIYSVFRSVVVLVPLVLLTTFDVASMTILYASCMTAVAPVSFWLTKEALGLSWNMLLKHVGVFFLASLAGFVATLFIRDQSILSALIAVRMIELSLVFTLVYSAVSLAFGRAPLFQGILFLQGLIRSRISP